MRLIVLLLFVLVRIDNSFAQKINPEQCAPNFTLPTLRGRVVYKGLKSNETNIGLPIIFHEFTNHSGFLESLWNKESSLLELIDNSPENTHYVFLSSSNDAVATAEWMKAKFKVALEKYFNLAKNLSTSVGRSAILGYNNGDEEPAQRRSFNNLFSHKTVHNVYPIPRRRIEKRSLNYSYFDLPKIRKPSHINKRGKPQYLKDANLPDLPKIRKPSILKRTKVKTGPSFKWHKYAQKHQHLKAAADKHEHIPSYMKPFHEHLTFDKKKSKKRSIIYHLRSEIAQDDTEEYDTSALRERIRSILRKDIYEFMSDWFKRLHFVTIPLYEVGNWLPLIMARWYCSGHGCGLDQIAIEGKDDGDVKFVSKRLDGRYDWVPSPYVLKAKHPRMKISSLDDGCTFSGLNITNQFALISRKGDCSFFTKIKNAQLANALAAIIYTTPDEPLVDMTCENQECEEEMKIPATMIPHESGKRILREINFLSSRSDEGSDDETYIKFQHTPSRNFFVAIDEQGKLQEVGWLLYPSMIFLSYQAKWLNYKTSLLNNISNMNADVVTVFGPTIMHGENGVNKSVSMKSLKELQRYKHVYLDMSLDCPGTSDYTCPHWDHTVQLFVCCNTSSALCDKEVGRWITPFRRRIGRWLTNIEPLLPMITCKEKCSCNFVMKTVPWAMPWKPSLRIRLADKQDGTVIAPAEVVPLFRGGKFDKLYNKRCLRELNFTVPEDIVKVKLVATITGHGSDNNNCAEFCVTSHHFILNEVHKNSRIYDTAGTATGCADRVSEGSEPNEHGTWLYGRDGWCDGQNVSPWMEDITDQVNIGGNNTIRYYGQFNNTDPDPTANPGNIIMYSYLVLYKDVFYSP